MILCIILYPGAPAGGLRPLRRPGRAQNSRGRAQGGRRPRPRLGGGEAPEEQKSEKGEVLLRGVGTLRYSFLPNASVQWQPDGLTIHTKRWFPGAGFLGAPPIFLVARGPLPRSDVVPTAAAAALGSVPFPLLASAASLGSRKGIVKGLVKGWGWRFHNIKSRACMLARPGRGGEDQDRTSGGFARGGAEVPGRNGLAVPGRLLRSQSLTHTHTRTFCLIFQNRILQKTNGQPVLFVSFSFCSSRAVQSTSDTWESRSPVSFPRRKGKCSYEGSALCNSFSTECTCAVAA